MKETHRNTPESYRAKIVWPKDETVILSNDKDYVFIFRKDLCFATKPVAEAFSRTHDRNMDEVQKVLIEEYDIFFAKLVDMIQWGHSHKGNVEIHIFDPDELEKKAKQKAKDTIIFCLDPLVTDEVDELAVSREYIYGGRFLLQRIARPGSASFEQQIDSALQKVGNKPISLLDDDLFRGGTLLDTIQLLESRGVSVHSIIPEIKLGNFPLSLPNQLKLDPVVEYKNEYGQDVLNKANLADSRDYLFGFSGLVVKLPSGEHGRSPYVLPFLPTSEKTGIRPKDNSIFAEAVLKANLDFFSRVEEKLGKPLQLRHMHPDFIRLMREIYVFDLSYSMKDIVMWVLGNSEDIYEQTQQLELIGRLHEMGMPDKLVFVDVNGTIFSEEIDDGEYDKESLMQLKETISTAQKLGFGVGLCSDSSLAKLELLAKELNLEGPILAENGNIVKFGEQTIIVRSLEGFEDITEEVRKVLTSNGFEETIDLSPLVFGGIHADYDHGKWSFGSGRISSISIYAPKRAIETLSDRFEHRKGLSIDVSPDHNYFCIHPNDYSKNKSKTLQLIRSFTKNVLMIGNSSSDWMEPETSVDVGFVKNASVDDYHYNKAKYRAARPLCLGVSDILLEHIGGIPDALRLENPLMGGEVNLTYAAMYDQEPAVFQQANSIGIQRLVHLSEYFNQGRLDKVIALQPVLKKYGIPAPKVLVKGNGFPAPWVVFERAEGVNLATVFPYLSNAQREISLENMAACLSNIHNIPLDEITDISMLQKQHPDRFYLLVSALVDFLLLKDYQAYQAVDYFNARLNPPNQEQEALIHRDFFQRNIFINPESLQITSVIDWGDTCQIGNITEDVLLAADWIAGQDSNAFWNFIHYYNYYASQRINIRLVPQLLEGYKLQWFCEMALYNYIRKDETQLQKQLRRINNLLTENDYI